MKARLMTILAAVIAIGAIGVGCGGDESTSAEAGGDSGGTSSSSKAEFIKQASAACADQRKNTLSRIAAYSEKHQSEGLSEAELGQRAIRVVILSTIAGEIDALKQLDAPSGDEQEIEGIMAAQEKALDEARARAHKSYDDIEDYFVKASAELTDYGLPECSKGTG